ncbi:MAG: hypothetical protein QOI95_1443 [Acidimicrobiaceae bacterium]|jgi:HD-GYP domain-containing protein (c-di-GMP phosphodiesterase class II)
MVMTETLAVQDALLEDLDGGRWRARSGAARAVGVAWYAVHLGVAFAVTAVVARAVGRPSGLVWSIGWFLGLSCVASFVLEITQRLGRRLIPLRALLRLSLAFPGVAPSRYAIALRAGNPRFLARRLNDANENAISAGPATPEATAVTLLELVAALSRHDRALRGHSERVRAYSELVAVEFGLDRGARDGLRWAGLMHDVGKLEIPSAVLNKAGPLSPDEWTLIRRHPEVGAELCAPLAPWLGEWAAGVLDHHERWDGAGYPRGLASTDISLAGRVVAVADAFDVMTSARSYKKPRPVHEAMAELERCAGTQFDPNVVRAFLGISVRKLRRVMGPVTVWAQRPFGGWSWGKIVDTLGGPLVAVCVAMIVGLLAPILGVPAHSQPERAPGIDREVPGGGGGASLRSGSNDIGGDLGAVGDGASGGSPTIGSSAGSPADGVNTPTAPGSATNPPADPEPGDGTTSPPSPTGDPNTVGITIDPAAGSVSVDGVGPVSAPDVTVVQQPAAGDVACGSLGVCDPVSVTVPVPAP